MKKSIAIKKCGGVKGLADVLGITVHAIYQWGDKVPDLRAYQLRELRPDVFASKDRRHSDRRAG